MEEEESGNNDGPIYVGGNFNPIHVIQMLFNEVIYGRITFEEQHRLLASFWTLIDCSGTVLRLAIDQARANEVTKYPLPLVCTESLSTVQESVQPRAGDIDQLGLASDLLKALIQAAGKGWYMQLKINKKAWKVFIDFMASMTAGVRLYCLTTIEELLQECESGEPGGMNNDDSEKVASAINHFKNKNEGLADDNHTIANLVESCIIPSLMESTSSAEDKQAADTLLPLLRKFFSLPSLNDEKYSLVASAPLTSTIDEIRANNLTLAEGGYYNVTNKSTKTDRRTAASRTITDAIFAAKLVWSGTLLDEQQTGIYSLLLTKLSKTSSRGGAHDFMLPGKETDVHEKMKGKYFIHGG